MATRTPEDYGAIGDGVTDDSTAIADLFTAITANDTVILTGVYIYGAGAEISQKDGVTFMGGGTLKVKDSTAVNDNLHFGLKLDRCDNCTIVAITIDGNRAGRSTPDADSRQNHLILIEGSLNFTVTDCVLLNGPNDGMYITEGSGSEQPTGTITDTDVDNYGRQGITIISCDDVTIDGGVFNDGTVFSGTGFGIDLEPNTGTPNVARVLIKDVTISTDNATGGIGVIDTDGDQIGFVYIENADINAASGPGISSNLASTNGVMKVLGGRITAGGNGIITKLSDVTIEGVTITNTQATNYAVNINDGITFRIAGCSTSGGYGVFISNLAAGASGEIGNCDISHGTYGVRVHGSATTLSLKVYNNAYASVGSGNYHHYFDPAAYTLLEVDYCSYNGDSTNWRYAATNYATLAAAVLATTYDDNSVEGSTLSAGTRWWSGANPVDVNREPFSDWAIPVGSVQSTTVDFHPSKL